MSGPVNLSSLNQKKLILKAISGDVKLPAVSRTYVLGLVFTAGAILLLPLLYLSVVVLLLTGLFSFIRQLDLIFAGWQTTTKMLALSTVVFVSGACVLGLIKPFWARSSTVKRPRTLRRDAEPFLYEYVDQLCDAMGAIRPTDIHVTSDLNAAAEFRRGWCSLFSNQGISLHLGLPLIAGLTLRQFTGVLAHEMGHFTQRTAVWLENIVRRTNLWFLRAAYERDAVDEWLAARCATSGPFAIPCYFACGIVWITRQVLLGLAHVGTILSCLMSREMEFNADRCQVRTVGSRTFGSTMWRMRELTVAHQSSMRDIAAFLGEGRLPDDLPALVLANTTFITPKIKKAMRRMMLKESTGLFDSHPSDRDRIQAGFIDGSPGFFQRGSLSQDLPASVLFSRFEEISKVVTVQFYENALKQPIKVRMLHPVDSLLKRQTGQIDAAKALKRYFQTEIPLLRPLPIAAQATNAPENPREVANELNACRERMRNELPLYSRLAPRYRTAEETLFETIIAQTLLQAKLPFEFSDYHLKEATAAAIADKQARAREGVAHLAGMLLPFETEAGNRLSFSLQLLHVPAVVRKIPHGDELVHEMGELLPEAKYVSRLIGELPTLRIVYYRLVSLADRLNGTQINPRVAELVTAQSTTLRSRLVSIQNEMGDHLYPFDHAQADTTLREYALPHVPAQTDLKGLVGATEQMQSRLVTVQARLFARLAQAAEKIEQAIGMPPLPEPESELAE